MQYRLSCFSVRAMILSTGTSSDTRTHTLDQGSPTLGGGVGGGAQTRTGGGRVRKGRRAAQQEVSGR